MSNKKYHPKKNKSPKKRVNVTGLAALQKCRFFIYLIFAFSLITMFHHPIAAFFHVKDQRILYGLVLMIAAQVIVASMHIVRYATTIEEFVAPKEQKLATMYTARVRLYILFQSIYLILLVLNHLQIGSMILDVVLVFGSVFLVVKALQNLTILQRNYL